MSPVRAPSPLATHRFIVVVNGATSRPLNDGTADP